MTVAEFIDSLRLERLRRRLSQGVLATQLGIKQGVLSGWEAGRTTPWDENLRRWAAALGVPVPDGVHGRLRVRCGTDSGYLAHGRRGEKACDACRKAHNAYMVAWRTGRR